MGDDRQKEKRKFGRLIRVFRHFLQRSKKDIVLSCYSSPSEEDGWMYNRTSRTWVWMGISHWPCFIGFYDVMILLLFLLLLVGQRETAAKRPECLEPAYEGRYLSLHVFWSYSPTLGECVQKTFGGPSPPGRNHFDSLEDCKEACVD